MLEYDVIQSRGFRNVEEGGRAVGFQLQLRMPNYRGVAGSLLDSIVVTVDDETWPADVPRWTLQDRSFSIDELRASSGVRWQLDELATITVPRPGGCPPGTRGVVGHPAASAVRPDRGAAVAVSRIAQARARSTRGRARATSGMASRSTPTRATSTRS
jgi:hypothetical protein